jgi:hypothetical protein
VSAEHHPTYQLRIGGLKLSSAAGSAVLSLQVQRAKCGGAGELQATLGAGHGLDVALQDPVQLEMGWGANTEPVFTGRLAAIESAYGFGAPRLMLTAFDPLMRLMRAPQKPRSFQNQTPGDIVKAHAADAGIGIGTVQDGPRLAHALLHRQSAYEQCRTLAERCGFDLYASADGRLQFARFARRSADAVLQHGIDLLELRRSQVAAAAGVTVVPESPASSAGDETSTWLVKDPSAHAATAGDADTLTISDPLPGRPALQLGQAVELRGVPEAALNGVYELLALQHRLDVARGFSTILSLARLN